MSTSADQADAAEGRVYNLSGRGLGRGRRGG